MEKLVLPLHRAVPISYCLQISLHYVVLECQVSRSHFSMYRVWPLSTIIFPEAFSDKVECSGSTGPSASGFDWLPAFSLSWIFASSCSSQRLILERTSSFDNGSLGLRRDGAPGGLWMHSNRLLIQEPQGFWPSHRTLRCWQTKHECPLVILFGFGESCGGG